MSNFLQQLILYLFIFISTLLAQTTLNSQDKWKYSDCQELYDAGYKETGIYILWHQINQTEISVKTECQMKGNNVFTVIQRRANGNQNFIQNFAAYVAGFGNVNGDFWLGLKHIYYLTQIGNNVLTINMQDWRYNNRNARYSYFKLQDSYDYYLIISGFSGDVGDDLSHNNGHKFATFDKPDANMCAQNQKCGWWYNYCSYALPNGVYYVNGPYTPSSGFYDGIYWQSWRGYGYSLKYISMTLSRN